MELLRKMRSRHLICELLEVLLVKIEVLGAPEAHSGGFPLPGPSPFIDGGALHPIQMNGLALATAGISRKKRRLIQLIHAINLRLLWSPYLAVCVEEQSKFCQVEGHKI